MTTNETFFNFKVVRKNKICYISHMHVVSLPPVLKRIRLHRYLAVKCVKVGSVRKAHTEVQTLPETLLISGHWRATEVVRP